MQVRAGGTAGGAAQADDVSGAHPVPCFHVPAGQMAVKSLQAVGMANHHQVAVSAHIGRYPHLAVKRGGNRRSGRIRKVYALVPAAAAVAEKGTGIRHVGAHIGVQRIHHPDGKAVRNGVRVFAVGIHGFLVPVFREDTVRRVKGRVFHVAVGSVVVQHHLDGRIPGIQRISIGGGTQGGGFHFLPSETVEERIGLTAAVIFLGLQGKACAKEQEA